MNNLIDNITDDVCEYCESYHDTPMNTNQYNMCEGSFCKEMTDCYLEDYPFTSIKFLILVSELMEDCFRNGFSVSDIRTKIHEFIFECVLDGRIHPSNVPSFILEDDDGLKFIPVHSKTLNMTNDFDFDMENRYV